jgi:hypothetical protein
VISALISEVISALISEVIPNEFLISAAMQPLLCQEIFYKISRYFLSRDFIHVKMLKSM